MRVHVTNRSSYPRREWVLFGTPTETPHTYETCPGGTFLNVGRVTVPSSYVGLVDVEAPTTEPFRLHSAVQQNMVSGGFTPWVKLNDQVISLDPQIPEVMDSRLIVSLWRGRASAGICELFLYLFHDCPVAQFELRVTSESLATPQQVLDLELMLGTGDRALTFIHDHDTASTVYIAHKVLQSTPLNWGDAQGIVLRGAVLFYNAEMQADSTSLDTTTCLAQMTGPLFAMASWPRWGIWSKQVPPPRRTFDVVGEHAHLTSRYWRDCLMHPAVCIGAMRPADAGEQPEFGGWSHVTDVSMGTSELLWRKLCAAYREACRPIYYYDSSGDPIKSAQRGRPWVVWSEETHWHTGVSPDRLGRTHSGSSAGGWFGHDDQHQGWIHLAESYLLTGSRMLRRILMQVYENWKAALTLPSTHPNYATNNPGPGRAVGRFFLAIAEANRVYYDAALVTQAAKRFMECVYPRWKSKLTTGPIKAYTYIGPDPRTGFPTRETWAAWQDAILVQGLDAFLRVCGGSLHPQVHSALMEVITEVGSSFVQYGYTPSGDVAVAYMPIPGGQAPANYYDPAQATLYSGFNIWGLQGIGVVEERVPGRQGRCADLRARYEHQSDTRDTYVGTLLP